MRTIKEILRLKWACRPSNREIAQSCKIARSTVAECWTRASAVGLAWPLPVDLDDGTVEARIVGQVGHPGSGRSPTGPRFTTNSSGRA